MELQLVLIQLVGLSAVVLAVHHMLIGHRDRLDRIEKWLLAIQKRLDRRD